MKEFNIEDYRDYENVTIADFKVALANTEKIAMDELNKGNFKESAKYGVLYIKLNNLLQNKVRHSSKYGYDKKGTSK